MGENDTDDLDDLFIEDDDPGDDGEDLALDSAGAAGSLDAGDAGDSGVGSKSEDGVEALEGAEDVELSEADVLRARVAELEAALEQSVAEVAESKDRLLRKAADFDNARRRHQKEREDLTRYAGESVIKEVVPVLDDMERALQHVVQSGDAPGALVEGVEMVYRKFQQVLERRGVAAVEALGKPFDPQFHEAIQQLEDPSVPANTVVQELQKGFLLHDRLIRPSLVVVAKGGPVVSAGEDALCGEGSADDPAPVEALDGTEGASRSDAETHGQSADGRPDEPAVVVRTEELGAEDRSARVGGEPTANDECGSDEALVSEEGGGEDAFGTSDDGAGDA